MSFEWPTQTRCVGVVNFLGVMGIEVAHTACLLDALTGAYLDITLSRYTLFHKGIPLGRNPYTPAAGLRTPIPRSRNAPGAASRARGGQV